MPIALACPACATSVSVTADMAGKRAKCPECRMALALPSSLVELPDRGAGVDMPPPREATRAAGSMLAWVFGIAGATLAIVVLCGGTAGLFAYYFWRGGDEAAQLAAQVVVKPAGANLPPGAPPRSLRVTEFQGVFQVREQINQQDVVFKNAAGAVNNNKRCKEYVIDLEAGRTYTIDLESRDFDAYLRLEQLNGIAIMEDDDSGGGLNSRIQFTPVQTTSYVVVATSLGGGFGSFTLTVRAAGFSKPR